MSKKIEFKMVTFTVAILLFIFGAASNVHAYGAGPEPGDVMLKPGKLVGVMTAILGAPVGSPVTGYQITVTVAGSLWKISGTSPVALNPVTITIPITTTDQFDNTTAKDLENWTLENAGPPGVFSDTGGETLIITRVNEAYAAQAPSGTRILGAKVTVRAIRN